ncbi:MAG: hypothetical protein E7425_03340 [Ruminococcaceae bacterium]|nr:hypothetical protein [Oscillospiraceae bacterium]
MKLHVVRADPAGNITLFVLDPVPREERAALAAALLRLPGTDAEQVGFACEPRDGFDGRMEMAGGEFCGNASRAFGMLLARRRGVTGRAHYTLEVSGSASPVCVDVNVAEGTARAAMPLPRPCGKFVLFDERDMLVNLGGIVHFVTHHKPDAAAMDALEPVLRTMREAGALPDMEAYGVIFLHDGRMTPLVKVPAAGTLFWEGSCGSGSLAAAIVESAGTEDGTFARDYVQPAGVVRAEVERRESCVCAAYIGGSVTLGETMEIEI